MLPLFGSGPLRGNVKIMNPSAACPPCSGSVEPLHRANIRASFGMFHRGFSPWIITSCAWAMTLMLLSSAAADDVPEEPKLPAGKPAFKPAPPLSEIQRLPGRWSVSRREPGLYFFHDPEPLDLFSYHRLDSNKDGIDNVRLSHNEKFLTIRSQCYPNHPTAIFPNSGNPNTIQVQDLTFRIPLEPKWSTTITRVPMGPIAVALNGVVFFNPFEAGGMNAVEGYSQVWLDSCCGHPQQHGMYHYHKYPSCLKSPFPDEGKQHSPVIGFAFDGYPIYGPYEESGVMARDLKGERALDVCNGHTDPVRGYHYHVTPGRFPYVIGGYHGVPEPSNSRHLGHEAQTGAIKNNASGVSNMGDGIAAVRPGTAVRGKQHTLQIELTGQGRGLPPNHELVPTWAQIGPYEATGIKRQGRIVSIEINIPRDADVAVLLDCHLEFEVPGAPHPIVLKKNDVFRVVDKEK